MQYFATQLSSHQQTSRNHRANQYRKRRKHEPEDGKDGFSLSPEPDPKSRHSSRAHSHASHGPLEIAQLRTAGLLPEEDDQLPPAPFPHAPLKGRPSRNEAPKLQEELARPPNRLYAINASSKTGSGDKQSETSSLKSTHLNNLTTVMHRCVLQGDFKRAGRAWGMLLRTRAPGGAPVDPRNHARWGIGAEILLRRERSKDNDAILQNGELGMFSEEGFELAREYYERLIIQYPNRKLHPNNVDERTFYPAMFSLWILEISEKTKRKRQQLQKDIERSRARSSSIDDTSHDEVSDFASREDAIKVEELTQAVELVERLDDLISSPPFDKQANLLQLRGHVALWRSSLILGEAAVDEDWDMESVHASEDDDPEKNAQQQNRLTNGQKELQQAQPFLQRAEATGGPQQAATISAIQLKLKELARQLSRTRTDEDTA